MSEYPKMKSRPNHNDAMTSPNAMRTTRVRETDEYDLVCAAVSRMCPDTLRKIASRVLEEQVRDTVRTTLQRYPHDGMDLETVLKKVAEKLQRQMLPNEAQNFASELYDETGIDARNPKTAFVVPASTIQDIANLYIRQCSKSAR